ncbi:uncharacterized protein BYT42DRAFT_587967 [Radiomyces spectabilis]|uniref:uncharacterized protein n=1 Tax=Radiomyces spectabilis TaxID=64574 RepID=UPI0022202A01|nr:uncharacterized protein BYT42DRAFT_587967 [Radiomyces spectabilis]KAI8366819.1 hypothetical protein BYT42DRAFT_587967 [Radiomyces spectabilis]
MANHKLLLCLFLLAISTISNARWVGTPGPRCMRQACADNEKIACQAINELDAYHRCPEACADFGDTECFIGSRICCLPK